MEWPRHIRRVPHDDLELAAGDELERRQFAEELLLQLESELHHRSRGTAGNNEGDKLSRQRKKLERSGGDHPERTFRSDEQILEVVTAVVLAQRAKQVERVPICEDDFEAKHQIAHVSIAQHGGAAGVGRQVAADVARTLGAET